MPLLSPDDVNDFRDLVADLAFHDRYELLRPKTGSRDSRGNRVRADQVVEVGDCNLRSEGLRPTEQVIADAMGATAHYAIDLPADSEVTTDDRIVIAGRTFHVVGVVKADGLAMVTTAICEERTV